MSITPAGAGNQSLARGLQMLRILADDGPLTATELGARLGIHQSSASRGLAALIEAGYVRKDDHGRFECSYGVLGLADSVSRLPLVKRLRAGARKIIERYPDVTIAVCMLWRQDVLHLARARTGQLSLWNGGWPLNVSTPGLRLLAELPDDEAVAILDRSRERVGWGGRPGQVPETAAETITLARKMITDEVLLVDGWWRPHHATGAILVRTPEPAPVSLAVVDEAGDLDPTEHKLLLHRIRRDLEAHLN
ncbi:helix-turn-helix domain-containing protein [Microlunatus sp. GCM10028923]|uniref:helix-turn-helix domain-containing protein n=1 Tax=Microlunatus sp. GCM10028923 TaxID=3273400 RepID=UPI0036234C4C